jgi:glycosyltransferase involved in cell wall biosynthesis
VINQTDLVENSDGEDKLGQAMINLSVYQDWGAVDIFVLPSLNEGISNTILEAMSTGIPVVATAVGGNPELVEDGVTGRLFEPGDVGCLTNILRDYIQDPALSHRHGKAGRRRVVSDFSIESMTDAYESLYQSNRDLDSAARSWAQ